MARAGFSLIESLVALSLGLILAAGGAQVLTFSLQAKRKGDLSTALNQVLLERLESLKALPFDDEALSEGEHAHLVSSEPGSCRFEESWTVADEGDGMKRIALAVKAVGRPGPAVTAVLLICRELGFAP